MGKNKHEQSDEQIIQNHIQYRLEQLNSVFDKLEEQTDSLKKKADNIKAENTSKEKFEPLSIKNNVIEQLTIEAEETIEFYYSVSENVSKGLLSPQKAAELIIDVENSVSWIDEINDEIVNIAAETKTE